MKPFLFTGTLFFNKTYEETRLVKSNVTIQLGKAHHGRDAHDRLMRSSCPEMTMRQNYYFFSLWTISKILKERLRF